MGSIGPGTGTRLWSPRDGGVVQPYAWYDASRVDTLTQAATLVSPWRDLSINRWDLTTRNTRPATGTRWSSNSLAVTDWNGTSNELTTASQASFAQPVVVMAAVQSDTTAAGVACFICSNGAGLNCGIYDGSWDIYAGAAHGRGAACDTNPHIVEYFCSGAASSVTVDGVETVCASNPGTSGVGNILVLGGNVGFGQHWDGWLGEFLLFVVPLTVRHRVWYRHYLGAKWGIPVIPSAFSPPLVFA